MHLELKKELKEFERELSVLVARFLKIYDEVARSEALEEAAAPKPAPTPPQAPDTMSKTDVSVPRDALLAYA
jgi:hypothetical protein